MTDETKRKGSSIFWELHKDLPREGPGDNESTRKAFLMASELPQHPRILDVACGPGMQTMELAGSSGGEITALDTHRPFLDELNRRAAAVGVADRVKTVNASMFSMPFEGGSFDLIWCEGAVYLMGLREALIVWRKLLTPRGYVALTEPSWLQNPDEAPARVRAYWAEYPGMTTIDNTKRIMDEEGFDDIGHFVLPAASWWTDYYGPMLERLEMLREKYHDDPKTLAMLDVHREETNLYRQFSEVYGYVFFVMRKRR
jgi:SAM-dependent methyltransferase